MMAFDDGTLRQTSVQDKRLGTYSNNTVAITFAIFLSFLPSFIFVGDRLAID